MDVAKILAWFVKKVDKDGLELYHTVPDDQGRTRHQHIKTSTQFADIAMSLKCNRPSDITDILGDILDEYGKRLKHEDRKGWDRQRLVPRLSKAIKPMTIYIFTDAVWTPNSDPTDEILKIVRTLQQNSQYGSRQLGIQFIQWGPKESVWTKRLRRLDALNTFCPDIFRP